jgi:hypothetical protein
MLIETLFEIHKIIKTWVLHSFTVGYLGLIHCKASVTNKLSEWLQSTLAVIVSPNPQNPSNFFLFSFTKDLQLSVNLFVTSFFGLIADFNIVYGRTCRIDT